MGDLVIEPRECGLWEPTSLPRTKALCFPQEGDRGWNAKRSSLCKLITKHFANPVLSLNLSWVFAWEEVFLSHCTGGFLNYFFKKYNIKKILNLKFKI
jgi:hypothetical protein